MFIRRVLGIAGRRHWVRSVESRPVRLRGPFGPTRPTQTGERPAELFPFCMLPPRLVTDPSNLRRGFRVLTQRCPEGRERTLVPRQIFDRCIRLLASVPRHPVSTIANSGSRTEMNRRQRGLCLDHKAVAHAGLQRSLCLSNCGGWTRANGMRPHGFGVPAGA